MEETSRLVQPLIDSRDQASPEWRYGAGAANGRNPLRRIRETGAIANNPVAGSGSGVTGNIRHAAHHGTRGIGSRRHSRSLLIARQRKYSAYPTPGPIIGAVVPDNLARNRPARSGQLRAAASERKGTRGGEIHVGLAIPVRIIRGEVGGAVISCGH